MACDTMEGDWSSASEGYVISDMMACNELHAVTISPGLAMDMVRLTRTKPTRRSTEAHAKKRKG